MELVLILGLSQNANIDFEEPAAIPGRGWKLILFLIFGRRYEELSAYKFRACDIPRWEGDLPNYFPVRGDAKHFAAAVDGSPDAPFGVHGKSIGYAGAIVEVEMNSPVADVAGLCVEVERENFPRRRIRQVHSVVLRVPPDAIGDGHLCEHAMELEIGVQSEQDPFVRGLLHLRVIHSPSPESSMRIYCPIVEAHSADSSVVFIIL